MQKDTSRLVIAVCIAAVLWFYMFSPWTGKLSCFWPNMSISAVILSSMAVPWSGLKIGIPDIRKACSQILPGILIAFVLWGIFWIGDKLSQVMFSFAREQVDNVYAMKDGANPSLIVMLLLVLIGPAEEFFWRGYVQKTISDKLGANTALVATTVIYALVHIWSLNFMLVMAALVAGAVWGGIYRIKPSLLPALVVSHAIWDVLVFVVFPI